jgi:hypothetical protein
MNLRHLSRAAAFAALLLAAPSFAQTLDLPRPSPSATISQVLGITKLDVTYSRPGVKGREIWGKLVEWDKPWRTGANEATTFTTAGEITVGGQKLAAGTYSLFTIPTQNEWTVVFNKEKNLWGAYEYKQEQDALRIQVKPTTGAPHTEWMQFTFENLTPQSADLVLRWEKLMLAIPIASEVNTVVLANARAAVAAAKPDDFNTPRRAAAWLLDNKLEPALAMTWAAQAAKAQENYYTVSLLARAHATSGDKKQAIALAEKAIKIGKEAKEPVDTKPTETMLAEWKDAK